MSLSSAIFFSESFEQNSALLSEFEFQKLRMRPGAAPTIANLERKPFSKALMRNPLGESYTGARGKVAYEVNLSKRCTGVLPRTYIRFNLTDAQTTSLINNITLVTS